MTNILLNVALHVFLKVLPLKEVNCLVNTIIASYRIIIVLYKDIMSKGKVFGNLYFPVPT